MTQSYLNILVMNYKEYMEQKYPSDEEVNKSYINILDKKYHNVLFQSEDPFKKRGANSERAEMIEQLCKFMNDNRFTYWLGRTKKLQPSKIYELMQKAKNGRTPQSLFNWLLKNELSKMKK